MHPTGKKNCWHTEEKKMRTLAGVEDEEKWLAEGIAGIQHNAFFMHRALVRSCSYIPPTELSPFWSDEVFLFVSQDANNLREVLKYSALMLSELRTSKLSPQKYYDLCRFHRHNFESLDFLLVFDRFLMVSLLSDSAILDMRAFDQLRQLEIFFKDESRHGLPVVDLYELVQHAGNILPRM